MILSNDIVSHFYRHPPDEVVGKEFSKIEEIRVTDGESAYFLEKYALKAKVDCLILYSHLCETPNGPLRVGSFVTLIHKGIKYFNDGVGSRLGEDGFYIPSKAISKT